MERFKTGTGLHFRRRLIVAGMALLASGSTSSVAHSDTMEAVLTRMMGTLEVHMEPYMNSGQLKGCDLLYTAIGQDWTYRQGGYIKVTGNVGFIKSDGSIESTLKVVVFDIDTSKPSIQFIPSPPSRAYLIGENYQNSLASLVESGPSDTPGALFSVFQISPTFEILIAALRSGKLTIAFNRDGGATDIQLPLELDVKDVTNSGERLRSDEAKNSFVNCTQELMK